MKKFICGVVLGLFLQTGLCFAYRPPKPFNLNWPLTQEQIIQLNDSLAQIWDVLNGRYNVDVVNVVPSGTGTEGHFKCYSSGGTRRLYFYIDGAWHNINFDG